MSDNYFTPLLDKSLLELLPEQFPFPYNYAPDPAAIAVANILKEYIEAEGFREELSISGKMFGVLIVKNSRGEIGYLKAYSGNLAGSNSLFPFVPPMFNLEDKQLLFNIREEQLNGINREIERLESESELGAVEQEYNTLLQEITTEISALKGSAKEAKRERKERRNKLLQEPLTEDRATKIEAINDESRLEKLAIKRRTNIRDIELQAVKAKLTKLQETIAHLKQRRKSKSAKLQAQLFDLYQPLNSRGESQKIRDIFLEYNGLLPPSGTGDCAAPKLLHFAFKHGYTPITMAEFWSGASPKSVIRRDGEFYPACRGKCLPILNYMLDGMAIDSNPLLAITDNRLLMDILFEDEYIAVVNKPSGLLSVPGKDNLDSLYLQIEERYPDATGPLLVHRLDMSTSGIVLIAKSIEVHKELQSQFINREVKKRYLAVISGVIPSNSGVITLPIRVDLDDRPKQMVCYSYGKESKTHYKVISQEANSTRIHLFPVTGRTHQLRVHAAHVSGLNCPIIGDELYGRRGGRLHLHADKIEFKHPVTKEIVTFYSPAPF